MSNDLQIITETVMSAQPFYEAVDTSPERTANFNREAGFALQIMGGSSYMRGVAIGNRQSVIDAVTNIAAVGLSLNPALKQAYLVPRAVRKGEKPQVCLDISYIGLIDLAIMGGAIKWAVADLVFEADKFTLHGVDQRPTHERNPFLADRGIFLGAYVVAKTPDGDFLTTMMSSAEITDIRDRSEAWKAKLAGKSGHGGPWESDFGEMAKKTVIKRAAKLWSKTDQRLAGAIQYLNVDNGEGLPAIAHHLDESEPETRRQATLRRLDKHKNEGGVGAERAKVLRAAAGECIQKWNEGDEVAAFESIEWLDDADEQEIVWAILAPHSSLRTAIKRLDAEKRAQQARVDEAARLLAASIEAAAGADA